MLGTKDLSRIPESPEPQKSQGNRPSQAFCSGHRQVSCCACPFTLHLPVRPPFDLISFWPTPRLLSLDGASLCLSSSRTSKNARMAAALPSPHRDKTLLGWTIDWTPQGPHSSELGQGSGLNQGGHSSDARQAGSSWKAVGTWVGSTSSCATKSGTTSDSAAWSAAARPPCRRGRYRCVFSLPIDQKSDATQKK